MKKTPHKKLQGLEKITSFLKLIILSSNIQGERPLSCMIVAPVSSGKTTLVKQFTKNPQILITTDSTAYGIIKNYQNDLKNGQIRHIIIPDLLNSLAKKKNTADALLLFINASSEDGLFPSKSYGIDISQYIAPFGWVLCLTDEGYNKKKKFLDGIGFLSRFFILHYKYNLDQINQIICNIINEENIDIPDIKIKTAKSKVKILGNKKIFEELRVFSTLLCKSDSSQIIRMQRKLQALAKASALSRGDIKVTYHDLAKIKDLIELIK